MNILQHLLDSSVMIEAVEFGRSDEFILVSRRAGQRKERRNRLTMGQLQLVLVSMREHGEALREAIDELYEKHQGDYDLRFRGKWLRLDLKPMFGKALSMLDAPGLTNAA